MVPSVNVLLAERPGLWCVDCFVSHMGLRADVVFRQIDAIPLAITVGACGSCRTIGPTIGH